MTGPHSPVNVIAGFPNLAAFGSAVAAWLVVVCVFRRNMGGLAVPCAFVTHYASLGILVFYRVHGSLVRLAITHALCSIGVALALALWSRKAGEQIVLSLQLGGAFIALFVTLFGLNLALLSLGKLVFRRTPASSEGVACLECGYRVDNIPSRRCPECGAPISMPRDSPASMAHIHCHDVPRRASLVCLFVGLGLCGLGIGLAITVTPVLRVFARVPRYAVPFLLYESPHQPRTERSSILFLVWSSELSAGETVLARDVAVVMGQPEYSESDKFGTFWIYLLDEDSLNPSLRGVALLDVTGDQVTGMGFNRVPEAQPGEFVYGDRVIKSRRHGVKSQNNSP